MFIFLQMFIWIYVITCIVSIIIIYIKYPDAKILNTKTNKVYDSGTNEYNIELIKLILKWPYLLILTLYKKLKGDNE